MTSVLNTNTANAATQVIKRFNFQPDNAAVPAGYTKDFGEAYSDARGYGWVKQGTSTPLDIKANSRDRNRSSIDQRLDTLIHMQGNDIPNFNGVKEPATWQCKLDNGKYSVTVSVGDQPGVNGYDSQHTIRVQGIVAINRFQGSSIQEYMASTIYVDVTNGLLSVDALEGKNTKINYIEIVSIKAINFQPDNATVPAGYTKDIGEAYNDSRGYGWVKQGTSTPLDIKANSRERNRSDIDQRLDTLIHMQGNDIPNFNGVKEPSAWECALPNGTYSVTVSVGDQPGTGGVYDSQHTIRVQGGGQVVVAINRFQANRAQEYQQNTVYVEVTNGKLTIDANNGNNTKINYIEIFPDKHPNATCPSPATGKIGVLRNTAINLDVNLLGAGVEAKTLQSNVQLFRTRDNALVPGVVNTTGGGDAIVFQPTGLLEPSTNYTLKLTQGVKDTAGVSFLPFSMTFTTGTIPEPTPPRFNKTKVYPSSSQEIAAPAPLSSLVISRESPDKSKLYAAALDGKLRRWTINPSSGNLTNPETLELKELVDPPRAIIGICFDPNDSNVLWISHNDPVTNNCNPPAKDFTGKISKLTLSGADFKADIQDYIIGLPRSGKDHLSNSLVFGPDGKLYLTQGSNTAMGAPDGAWCNRPERLLSAAVLQIDPTQTTGLPINVQTEGLENNNNYNPSAPNAPVKIYATGIRNAYDLVWHSNGKLYVPTNGSAAGGNTPASPSGTLPVVPALTNVSTQNDFLFKVEQGGYYGHPNPLRQQYIMNGGNPDAQDKPDYVVPRCSRSGYPLGTAPAPNYKGYAHDFGRNRSPNGVIEYKFASSDLKSKLLVVEYSGGDDIVALALDANGNVNNISNPPVIITSGLSESLTNPLDLVEDTKNGNIYVAELLKENPGQSQISLLRPL